MALPSPYPRDSLAQHAAHLAQLFAVFPVHSPLSATACSCGQAACGSIGKHPRVPSGVKEATRDPASIAAWWARWLDANIGIATGAASGTFVLDVDGPEGTASLAKLTSQHGPLPQTLTAATGRGAHYYFRIPPGTCVPNSTSRVGAHLDVRGDGGYVVAPPSLHASGVRYTWSAYTTIADAPAWLLALVVAPPLASVPAAGGGGPFLAGGRNTELCSHAGKLRRSGADQQTIERALLALNAAVCQPPLAEAEVRRIASSVARYAATAVPPAFIVPPPTDIVITRLDTLPDERVDWLWHGWLPRGALAILDGDPGLGKSTVAIDIAARVTQGTPMPGGMGVSEASGVLFLTAEDSFTATIRPRLRAAEADLSRVAFFEIPDGDARRLPTLPDDIDAYRRAIAESRAALVVIDPLVAFLAASIKANHDQDVRRALGGLARLAEETRASFLLIRHLNKNVSVSAMYRGGGSIGIVGAARVAWLAARDPADDEKRILAVVKSNLGRMPRSRGFHLEDVPVMSASRVVWDEECDARPDDLLRAPPTDEERSALADAKGFLTQLLADGPVDAKKAMEEGKQAGIATPTLKRAKAMLGIKSTKGGMTGGWVWTLTGQQLPLRVPNERNGEADPHATDDPVRAFDEEDHLPADPLRGSHEEDRPAGDDPLRRRNP